MSIPDEAGKRVPPSVGEFAVGERDQLLARVAELEAGNLELSDRNAAVEDELARNLDYRTAYREAMAELAALKQPSAGVGERAADALEQAIGLIDLIEHHQPALDQARRILVKLAGQATASAQAVEPAYETCNGKGCGWCKDGAEPCLFTEDQRKARLNASRDVPEGFREARCIGMRPGMGEVTVYIEGGSVPGFMDPGCTVYIAAAPSPAPASDDCEWCAGAGHDHYGVKCEHCKPASADVVPVPQGWSIELGFDVLEKPLRCVDKNSHIPTIKVRLPACDPEDSASWDSRDLIGGKIRALLNGGRS